MKYYLGVDLGGTNIAVGVVDEKYNIVGRSSVKTRAPRPAAEIVESIAEACGLAVVNAGIRMDEVEWMGIGSPGVIHPTAGEIEFASNLEFYNVPLRRMVFDAVGKPVYLQNDANAAAYGEVLAGGARGFKDVIALTLGTGVGGGIIIDGKIYGGFNDAGAELGHVGMMYSGLQCSCGLEGCVETYCSATALVRQTREKMLQNRASKMWALCEGDIDQADGRTAFGGLRAGDPAAIEVVEQFCAYLSYAVMGFINMLQPQVVLVGGGISKEGDTLLNPVRKVVRERCFIRDPKKQPHIEAAKLGNDAGIIGAAFLGTL